MVLQINIKIQKINRYLQYTERDDMGLKTFAVLQMSNQAISSSPRVELSRTLGVDLRTLLVCVGSQSNNSNHSTLKELLSFSSVIKGKVKRNQHILKTMVDAYIESIGNIIW